MNTPFLRTHKNGALGLEAVGMTKRFGGLTALDDVTMRVSAGSFHALLGENGAGKSTLVKCVMGYYRADQGQVAVGELEREVANPRDAHALGVGMVYQHFTLVPGMTVAENLVLSRAKVPAVVKWADEILALENFMDGMPFRVPLDLPVSALAAGEKQKLEILKQLYLKNRFLILDEPTSVLTPGEADEVLGLLRRMTREGKLTVLTITHKFREVMAYADEVTVLRRGRFAGSGRVSDLSRADMAEMMIGAREIPQGAARLANDIGEPRLQITGLKALNDGGLPAVEDLDLTVWAGEVVGIAGVSGNGQRELVEVLASQRPAASGEVRIGGERYGATRAEIKRHRLCLLPEEPLRNACVARMSVAENMSFRGFDDPPFARGGWWLNGSAMRNAARELISLYKVKTPGPDAPIGTLSGGNVQRAVLARELAHDVRVLIVANPCFGLDFAAVSEIRSQIMQARNRGAAVLLVSEDLDELFELADRILVMFDGHLVYETPTPDADLSVIGQHMAGHCRYRDTPVHRRGPMADSLTTVATAQPYPFTFPRNRIALVIIDMQRDFVEAGGFGEALGNDVRPLADLVPHVKRLLEGCRAAGLPIIHTREAHKPDLSDCPPAKRLRGNSDLRIGDTGPMGRILIAGEPGNAIVDELAPVAGEIVIDKPGKGAFHATGLSEILGRLGTTHLLFAGVTTEVCVQTTMREANDRGFECLLVEDATESYFPAFKHSTLDMIRAQGAIIGWTATIDEVLAALQTA